MNRTSNFSSKRMAVPLITATLLLQLIGCEHSDRHPTNAIPDRLDSSITGSNQINPYEVPTGGVSELLEFIDHLHSLRDSTPAEEFDNQAFPAMKQAATRIAKTYRAEEVTLPGFDRAIAISLYFRVTESDDNPKSTDGHPISPDARQRLVRDIANYFRQTKSPSNYAIVAAEKLPLYQERSGNVKRAISIYGELGPVLANSSDPRCAAIGEMMLGSARRLESRGNSLDIEGQTIDGTDFIWSKYRNKVVLVDFWSVHCQPCLVEIQQLRKIYDKYHEQGFEIIGINVDDEIDEVKRFLENSPVPWITLYDGPKLKSPMAKRYGVISLPTCLLVDRSGIVISIRARGEELANHLKEQFAF